jgi:ATP-binding cassette subfamily B (MDR/TAP) protein 1
LIPCIVHSGTIRYLTLPSQTFEGSAATASEYVAGIRTVAALSKEATVWQLYHDQLIEAERSSLKSVILSSLFFAMSQASLLGIFALLFWFGGKLIGSGEYGQQQFFICTLLPPEMS